MADIKCSSCRKYYDKKEENCTKCGYKNTSMKNVDKIFIFTGSVTLIAIVLIVFNIMSVFNSISETTNNEYFLAYSYAEKFVKKRLKAPSTAEFPNMFEKNNHITKLDNRKYKIKSWVDCQNSFGAHIRTQFSCVILIKNTKVNCQNLRIN